MTRRTGSCPTGDPQPRASSSRAFPPRSIRVACAVACLGLVALGGCAPKARTEALAVSGTRPTTLEVRVELPRGKPPYPVVILLHGCGGLTPAVNQALAGHAAFLREHGFATVVLDSFGPRGLGAGNVCPSPAELAAARDYRQRDVERLVEHLRRQPRFQPEALFLVGQSNGGSVALRQARVGTFAAVVALYPWCGGLPRDPSAWPSPVLVLAGDADDWTPPDECVSVAQAVGSRFQVELFAGAHHSFDLDLPVQTYAGHTVAGTPHLADAARERMLRHFDAAR